METPIETCPCDFATLIKNHWENCPELLECLEADQIAIDQYLGDPEKPWGFLKELTAIPISCNSNGDFYQLPLIAIFRCFRNKPLARKLRKTFYEKFHRRLLNQATECGVVCDFSLNWPSIEGDDYNYIVRFQATIKFSVSL